MKSSRRVFLSLLALALLFTSGCAYRSAITFPAPSDVFVTTGDGDIQKPYTPIGELIYIREGYRFPFPGFPILSLIPIGDPDVEAVIRGEISEKVKSMGGDGIINLKIQWNPPKNYVLFGVPSSALITGTVIKR